jgi:hypothetical protein
MSAQMKAWGQLARQTHFLARISMQLRFGAIQLSLMPMDMVFLAFAGHEAEAGLVQAFGAGRQSDRNAVGVDYPVGFEASDEIESFCQARFTIFLLEHQLSARTWILSSISKSGRPIIMPTTLCTFDISA